jgi:hypothetical protein
MIASSSWFSLSAELADLHLAMPETRHHLNNVSELLGRDHQLDLLLDALTV